MIGARRSIQKALRQDGKHTYTSTKVVRKAGKQADIQASTRAGCKQEDENADKKICMLGSVQNNTWRRRGRRRRKTSRMEGENNNGEGKRRTRGGR